jgi:hypothetical protein
MARCAGIKADGGRCGAQAIRDSQWCFSHHPDYEEQRRRRASRGGKRGGRGRPMAELSDLKTQLSDLYTSVLTDMVEPKTGAVLAQITNAQIRITEVELKVKEQVELTERLEQLEELAERQRPKGYGI